MPDTLHDRDFFAWTQEQAGRLRAAAEERRNTAIDWENVAEEIESMGRSQRSEIRSRLRRVLEHLIKLAYGTDPYPRRQWTETVIEQRRELLDEIEDSPSLKTLPAALLDDAYAHARRRVLAALDIGNETLPETCPFTLETQILDEDWFPEPPTR